MPSLKDIRKRISSVKNTQKITRALKLVSAAKLNRAQREMSRLKPYAEKQSALIRDLVAEVGAPDGKSVVVLLHGLFLGHRLLARSL